MKNTCSDDGLVWAKKICVLSSCVWMWTINYKNAHNNNLVI